MARPLPLTILAVVSIGLHVLGLCALPLNLYNILNNPLVGEIFSDWMTSWTLISTLLSLPLVLLHLVGAVGALMLKRWSRPVLYVWMLGTLLMGCAGTGVAIYGLMPALQNLQNMQDPAMIGGVLGGSVGGLCGFCFQLFWLGLWVAVLNLVSVRRAFAGEDAPINQDEIVET